MKLTDIKPGDKLKPSGDHFECLGQNAVRTVMENKDGLYVRCRGGRHYLDGQVEDDGEIRSFVFVHQ